MVPALSSGCQRLQFRSPRVLKDRVTFIGPPIGLRIQSSQPENLQMLAKVKELFSSHTS